MTDQLLAVGAAPPDRPALIFPEGTLSYGQLERAASAIAADLREGSRVAVWGASALETCVAMVAVLAAGAVAVPLNPRSGTRELAHMLSDSGPELVLVPPGAETPGELSEFGVRPVRLDVDAERVPTREVSPDAPGLIVYTSGTTGPPKGAVLSRQALSSNLDGLAAAWEWSSDDVVAHALPLFHAHGLVLATLGPLRRGGTSRHLGRFSPEAVAAGLPQATMMFGVPTMYGRLATAAVDDEALVKALAGARVLVSGSAGLPQVDHTRIQELTGRGVLERYGLTETLMNTAVGVAEGPQPGYVGRPVEGVEVRLVDDAGQAMEDSDDATFGEVEVRGPNVFLEYLNNAEATAAAFRDGWFRTGDLATRRGDGQIRLVGRKATDLIKSGGYKIGAGEIEGILLEHPAVEEVAITGEPDADLGERVVAWVVARPGQSATAEELIDHVAGQLAPHKRPRVVHFLDELPRNEMGKVQKKRLGA